jgi:hypothetical protein
VAGAGVPRGQIGTLEKIRDAIEAGGVEFLGPSQRSNGGGGSGAGRKPIFCLLSRPDTTHSPQVRPTNCGLKPEEDPHARARPVFAPTNCGLKGNGDV